ncbi:MAG: YqaJ viral recombinase family protein [Ekhidna sp.]|nr:YqaJ viral recombinase family protein [Ekhidna sp.]
MEQGTTEWLEARRGLVSCSKLYKLMTAKGIEGKEAKEYIRSLAWQRFTERVSSSPVTKEMERGRELEPEAKAVFQKSFLSKAINDVSLLEDGGQALKGLWASPDGLIYDDINYSFESGLEIKCTGTLVFDQIRGKYTATTDKHLYFIDKIHDQESFRQALRDKNSYSWYWQIQGNMYVYRVEDWYFVSYHPDALFELKSGKSIDARLFVFKVKFDNEANELIEKRVEQAEIEIQNHVSKLRKRFNI